MCAGRVSSEEKEGVSWGWVKDGFRYLRLKDRLDGRLDVRLVDLRLGELLVPMGCEPDFG